jgi:diketogulonate reductase-like aldo/keto reductase
MSTSAATAAAAKEDKRPVESTVAKMPLMMYGTAWKRERTADLVYEAIKAGFRGIDTAAMKRHYDEAGTGQGIQRAINDGLVKRQDLYASLTLSPNPQVVN